jgi:hypothetical protein
MLPSADRDRYGTPEGNVAHGCGCLAARNDEPICKHRAAYWYVKGVLKLAPEPEPPASAAPIVCWQYSGVRKVNSAACPTCHGAGVAPLVARPPHSWPLPPSGHQLGRAADCRRGPARARPPQLASQPMPIRAAARTWFSRSSRHQITSFRETRLDGRGSRQRRVDRSETLYGTPAYVSIDIAGVLCLNGAWNT